MMKKGITIGIVIVFLVGSFASGITINRKESVQQIGRGNTLYVGGSGPGNYTKIQDAIDNATTGDTVFVNNGTYYENVIIDKNNINLVGEDRDTTIIDGSSDNHGIYSTSDGITIKGLTVKNCGEMGIYTNALASDSLIEDCIISNNGNMGVHIYHSPNITIRDCYIHNNTAVGIDVCGSDLCIFTDCEISNNGFGIGLNINAEWIPENNLIYHNNVIGNTVNTIDSSGTPSNLWDNGYPSGGNYWDDYTGEDADGDGIGDTPYNISGGSNKDNFPLINPWGENPPVANFTHSGNESPVLFDGSSSYDRDGIIVNWTWGFGDGTTGYGMVVSHTYSETGTYNVTLTVTDDDGYTSNITKIIEIEVINQPPEAPIINGPTSGKPGTSYSYKFNATDPDIDDVYYYVDWGDDTYEDWFGPFNSGVEVPFSHTFTNQGTYNIYAKAKDVYGSESAWGTLTVTMPRNHAINTPFLNFLQKFFEAHPNLFPLLQLLLQRFGL